MLENFKNNNDDHSSSALCFYLLSWFHCSIHGYMRTTHIIITIIYENMSNLVLQCLQVNLTSCTFPNKNRSH